MAETDPPRARSAPRTLAFPDSPPVRIDAEGRVDADLPCPGCGYLLRGRVPGEGCPECGREIRVLARGVALAEEAQGFRASVRAGAGRLAWGVAILPLGIYPGLALMAAGVWGLTARPPGPPEPWLTRNGRWFARWFTAIGVPAMVASVLWAGWTLIERRGVGGSWTLQDAMLCGTHALFFIGLMFGWRHLFDLAARADAPAAALALKRLWRGYFVALLAVAAVGVMVNVASELELVQHVGRRWRTLAMVSPWILLAALGIGLGAWTFARVKGFRRSIDAALAAPAIVSPAAPAAIMESAAIAEAAAPRTVG